MTKTLRAVERAALGLVDRHGWAFTELHLGQALVNPDKLMRLEDAIAAHLIAHAAAQRRRKK